MDIYPRYLKAHTSGELRRRTEEAVAGLAACRVCPRQCGVNRLRNERGSCDTGRRARVHGAVAHHSEETFISGTKGSGTLFFTGCNLACVFCQNAELSQGSSGEAMSPEAVADLMLSVQVAGCHNLNLVSPSHVVPQVLESLSVAVNRGLRLPVVYNSGGYDALESLRLLDGVVDIYMPDLKFLADDLAERYLRAPGYAAAARAALREMHRQVGDLEIGEDGVAQRGLLVRHLVMPGLLENSRLVVEFLAREVSPDTCINIMAQYRPLWKVGGDAFPEINRSPSREEMDLARTQARDAGLHRFA